VTAVHSPVKKKVSNGSTIVNINCFCSSCFCVFFVFFSIFKQTGPLQRCFRRWKFNLIQPYFIQFSSFNSMLLNSIQLSQHNSTSFHNSGHDVIPRFSCSKASRFQSCPLHLANKNFERKGSQQNTEYFPCYLFLSTKQQIKKKVIGGNFNVHLF
jgi:hypothetical protein